MRIATSFPTRPLFISALLFLAFCGSALSLATLREIELATNEPFTVIEVQTKHIQFKHNGAPAMLAMPEQSSMTQEVSTVSSLVSSIVSVNPLPAGSLTYPFLCDSNGNHCLPGTSYLAKKIHTGDDLDTNTDEQVIANRVRATLPGIVAANPVTNVTCSARTDPNCGGLGNRDWLSLESQLVE
jgi:hypothetical protein